MYGIDISQSKKYISYNKNIGHSRHASLKKIQERKQKRSFAISYEKPQRLFALLVSSYMTGVLQTIHECFAVSIRKCMAI